MKGVFSITLSVLVLCLAAAPLKAAPAKVKVFILAGQSNMEGKGKVSLLEHQVEAPETKDFFKHLRKDGQWVVRDDVWVNFLNRHGHLTVGFGSPGCIGPELEFGNVLGDKFEEPVLLIKTAWGGKSLARHFRPPSSALPPEEELKALLDKENGNIRAKNEKENNPDRRRPETTMEELKARYGATYREMLKEIETVLNDLPNRFPAYKGQGYEIAGLVWFHGWNDMINPDFVAEYPKNLANLIRDLRKDLNAPKMPVVIGIMGQNGSKPADGGMLKVQEAQASMEQVPEFKGNVKAVRTDVLVDKAAEAIYPEWRTRADEWKLVGADFSYHYMGSALWFSRIGTAFGEAMLELLK